MILDNEEIHACREYTCLRVILGLTGNDNREITRIRQVRKMVGCLDGIWWNMGIDKKRKYNTYDAVVESSLLYAVETWCVKKQKEIKGSGDGYTLEVPKNF